jgi:CSLREA domain-containing protein
MRLRRRALIASISLPVVLTLLGLAAPPVPARAATTFTVNRIGDQPDLNLANSICDVSSNSGKQCTLRAAIQEANDTPGADVINFNITSASKVIAPATPLPHPMEQVTINGYSQSGASANTNTTGNNAVLKIILDGVNLGSSGVGLEMDSFNGLVKGLVIQRFGTAGIKVSGTKVVIEGNFIGTDAAGNAARPNGLGVVISGDQNTVGGSNPSQRNVISGNNQTGVSIFGEGADTNLVIGNYIGTKKGGTAALANGLEGVRIDHAPGNTVGGSAAASRNVISGNGGSGIYVTNTGYELVAGNYIGTNAAGTADLGNHQHGVLVDNSTNVQIGGASSGMGNVVSGNDLAGITFNAVNDSYIQGNKVGTNATGTAALGNVGWGLFFTGAEDNLIGGSTAAARNTISANLGGIYLSAAANTVRGNRIGTKADGTGDLGNQLEGIFVGGGVNTIGGTAAEGNVIANSDQSAGVLISGISAGGNVVQNNTIAGNAAAGVKVQAGGNQVLGNSIVANGAEGVLVDVATPTPTAVRISGNVMIANARLGINLVKAGDPASGVTNNDAGDGDSGVNHLQNFPALTQAVRQSNGVTVVSGSLNSLASTQFRIELFLAVSAADPSGHGEAQAMLATQNITTNASGNRGFAFQITGLAPGHVLTATAINVANNDTSEFSVNVVVVNAP